MTTDAPQPAAATPFHDLDAYVGLPRLSGLQLSPDGTRLVTSVATMDAKRTRYVTALWEVDPTGVRPARRLTRSAKGEAGAAFTPSGDLLFTSARPDPAAADPVEDAVSALWLLPRDGGEPRLLAGRGAGVDDACAARAADVVLVGSQVLPRAHGDADDDRLRRLRKDTKVSAILHSSSPVRYWDHDLGPASRHLFVADVGPGPGAGPAAEVPADESRRALRDITPDAGEALRETSAVLSPDGRTAVTGWRVHGPRASMRSRLVAVDVATGVHRVLLDDPDADLGDPVVSPDGRTVAYLREALSTPQRAPRVSLGVVRLDGTGARELTGAWDRWPSSVVWMPDSAALLVVADDDGRAPIFRVDAADGTVTRVTADDAAFSDVRVAPDGATAYALRTSYLAPEHPVRVDLARAAATGAPVEAQPLPAPAPAPDLPGTLTEIAAATADGARVRAWLALPEGASAARPAPLLLWVHGGPLSSWNGWSWRWNPWLMVARGYAVLLPDPALSVGYGQEFVQRGWGAWGAAPFTDLMAATDAAIALPEVDATRTAAMGGSFGGYMANWIAGHTDRFAAVVTHAGLWALDQFARTTDDAYSWQREMTSEMTRANSPDRSVAEIRTPMLVIHGDHDDRVPIGEALRLWYELLSASGLPADDEGHSPHRFLYFPDENHWVLSPQHAKVWYQVVLAFLSEHVLGEPADLPEALG